MKMLVMNRKSIVSILTTVLVSISLFVVGCGEAEDDTESEVAVNSQPSIGAILDQTVDAGDTMEVKVTITDTDVGDTHIISASSGDTAIATVAVNNTTLTITGIAEGMTAITVSATDDSGQDNAEATPETFEVTVDPYVPLEGLTVLEGRVVFVVGGIFFSSGNCIRFGGATLNGVTYNTHFSKWQRREDATSPWIDIPGTENDGGLCSYFPPGPGQYRLVCEISIGGVREKYASENILEI